jgi:uncharacterized phage protein (TIGR01671 family)
MRQLKFRVWDKEDKKYIPPSHIAINGNGILLITYSGMYLNFENEHYTHLSQKYVVQQFTGLKDSNDEDIYEGDTLIWYSQNGKDYEAKVVFSPTVAAFVLDVSGRHLIDSKYGDFQHLYEGHSYKIKK